VPERTANGHRRYELSQLLGIKSELSYTIGYCRVSSHDQKEDLARQKQVLELFCASAGWQEEDLATDVLEIITVFSARLYGIGVDLGVKSLATLSTGEVFEGAKSYRKLEKKLAHLQRIVSRRELKSNNWHKAQLKENGIVINLITIFLELKSDWNSRSRSSL
jgi:hypothetical protein